MKTLKVLAISLAVIFMAGSMFTSCKKNETNKTYSYRSAQDNATAEAIFSRSYNQISRAARQVGSKTTDTTIAGCPTLYISGTWGNWNVDLDFGTTGCTGDDGVVRTGHILSHIVGLYVDSNSVVTSTFQNYVETINGVAHQVQGTQVITNLGHNQAGHPHFSVDVQGASISFAEGTINYTSQRENEWISGFDTYMNPWDDEYNVTGTANGTDINGAAFTVNITNPLLCKFCLSLMTWVVASGTLDIVNSGYPTITVDYGDGSCDYSINVIINGVTYPIVYV
jgi:hypothetical protein